MSSVLVNSFIDSTKSYTQISLYYNPDMEFHAPALRSMRVIFLLIKFQIVDNLVAAFRK